MTFDKPSTIGGTLDLPVESRAPPVRWPQPGELWSRWDMLKIDGSDFYEAAAQLNWLRGVMSQHEHSHPADADTQVDEAHLAGITSTLEHAHEHAVGMGAQITAMSIVETLQKLKGSTWRAAGAAVQDIQTTFRRELSLTAMFILERDKAKF